MKAHSVAAPSRRPRWLSALPNLLGLGLLGWFCRSLDYAGFLAALAHISGRTVAGLLIAATLSTVFQGLRFYLLCPGDQGRLRHIWLNFALHAANILLPLRSGEVVRPFYMKRFNPQMSLSTLFGWSVADKVIEIVAFLPCIALMGWLDIVDSRMSSLPSWLGPALLAGGVGATVVSSLYLHGSLRRNRERRRPALLALTLLLSVLMWLANYLIFYLVVPDLALALALLVGVNAALVIPGLPGGIGTYEAAFLWIGQLGHLPKDGLLSAALISHLSQYMITLAIGLPVMLYWGWPRDLSSACSSKLGTKEAGDRPNRPALPLDAGRTPYPQT